MKRWTSIAEALDFAIGEEEKAAAFYESLAERVTGSGMKATLLAFAGEEKLHKARLLRVKAGAASLSATTPVADLKISDYLVDAQPAADMDYQHALMVAMAKEKAAFRLYHDLAGQTQDDELRQTFLGLAQEEAKHKLRFELEYDQEILREN